MGVHVEVCLWRKYLAIFIGLGDECPTDMALALEKAALDGLTS
jgi:hypothetical protein